MQDSLVVERLGGPDGHVAGTVQLLAGVPEGRLSEGRQLFDGCVSYSCVLRSRSGGGSGECGCKSYWEDACGEVVLDHREDKNWVPV